MKAQKIFSKLIKRAAFLTVATTVAVTAQAATLSEGWNLIHPGIQDVSSLGDAFAWNGAEFEQVTTPAADQGVWLKASASGEFTPAAALSAPSITSTGWHLLGAGSSSVSLASLQSLFDGAMDGLYLGKVYAFSDGQWSTQDLSVNSDSVTYAAGQGLWIGVVSDTVPDIGNPPELFSGLVSLDVTGQTTVAGRRLVGRRLYNTTTDTTSTVGETQVQLYAVDDEENTTPLLSAPIVAEEDGSYTVRATDFENQSLADATSSYTVKAAVSTIEVEEDGTVLAKVIEVTAIKPETEEGAVATSVVVDPVTTQVAVEIKKTIKTLMGSSFTISATVQSLVNQLSVALVDDYKQQVAAGTKELSLDKLALPSVEVSVDQTKQAAVKGAYDAWQEKVSDNTATEEEVAAAADALATQKAELRNSVATTHKDKLKKVKSVMVRQAMGVDVEDASIEEIADEIGADSGSSAVDMFASTFGSTVLIDRRKTLESSVAKSGTSIGSIDAKMAKLEQAVQKEQLAELSDTLDALQGGFSAANIEGDLQLSRLVYNTIADMARIEFAVSDGDGSLVVFLPVDSGEERTLPGQMFRIAVNITADDNLTSIPTGINGELCSADATVTDPVICLQDTKATWTTYVGNDEMLRLVNPESDLRSPHPAWVEKMMEAFYTPIVPNNAIYSMIKNRNNTVTLAQVNRAIVANAGDNACKDSESDTNADCFENLYYDSVAGTGVKFESDDPYTVAKQIAEADMKTYLKSDLHNLLMTSIDRRLHGTETPLQVATDLVSLLAPSAADETADQFIARISTDSELVNVVTDELVDTLARAIPMNHPDDGVMQLVADFELSETTAVLPKTAVALTVLMADKFVGEEGMELQLVPANEIPELDWMLGDALRRVLDSEYLSRALNATLSNDDDQLAALTALLFVQADGAGEIGALNENSEVVKIWWPVHSEFTDEQLAAIGVNNWDGGELTLSEEDYDALEALEISEEDFDGSAFLLNMFKGVTGDTRLMVESELSVINSKLETYVGELENKLSKMFGDRAGLAGFDAIDEYLQKSAYDESGGAGGESSVSVAIMVRDGYNWNPLQNVTGVALVPMLYDVENADLVEHPEYNTVGNRIALTANSEGGWTHQDVMIHQPGQSVKVGKKRYDYTDNFRAYLILDGEEEWSGADMFPLFPDSEVQNLDIGYWGASDNTGGDPYAYGPPINNQFGGNFAIQEAFELFHKDSNRKFFFPGIQLEDKSYVGEELLHYDGTEDTITPIEKAELRGALEGATVRIFVLAKNHEERDRLKSREHDDLSSYITKVLTGATSPVISPARSVGFFDGFWPERGCSAPPCSESENSSYDLSQYTAGRVTHGGLILVDVKAGADSGTKDQQLLLEVNNVFEDSNWYEVDLALRAANAEGKGPSSVFDESYFDFGDSAPTFGDSGFDPNKTSFGRGMSIYPSGEAHIDVDGSKLWNDDYAIKVDVFDEAVLSDMQNRLFIVVRKSPDDTDREGKMALFINKSGTNVKQFLEQDINLKTLLEADGYAATLGNKTGEFLNLQGWLDQGNTATVIGRVAAQGGFNQKLTAADLDEHSHITIDVLIVKRGYDAHAATLEGVLESSNNQMNDWNNSLIEQMLFEVLMPEARADTVFDVQSAGWSEPSFDPAVDYWGEREDQGSDVDVLEVSGNNHLQGDEFLYIANEGHGGGGTKIVRLSADGSQTDVGDGFNGVAGVAVAPNGDLFISDDRPAVYRVAAGQTNVEELPIRHYLSNPNALAINRAGDELVIADAGGQILSVALNDSNAVRELATCYNGPQAIAYGQGPLAGDLLFSDFSGSIYRIPNGEAVGCEGAEHYTPDYTDMPIDVTEFGSTEPRSGGLFPSTQGGLVIDAAGTTYVADYQGGVYRIPVDATDSDNPIAASAQEILRVNSWYPTRGLLLSSNEEGLYVTGYEHNQVLHLDLTATDAAGISASVSLVADHDSNLFGPFGMAISTVEFSDLSAGGEDNYTDPNQGMAFMRTTLDPHEIENWDTPLRGDVELMVNPESATVSAKSRLRDESGSSVPAGVTVTLRQQNQECSPSMQYGQPGWPNVANCPKLGDFVLHDNGEWGIEDIELGETALEMLKEGMLFVLVQSDATSLLTGRVNLPPEFEDDLRHGQNSEQVSDQLVLDFATIAGADSQGSRFYLVDENQGEKVLESISLSPSGDFRIEEIATATAYDSSWQPNTRPEFEAGGDWWIDDERGSLMLKEEYSSDAEEFALLAIEDDQSLRFFDFSSGSETHFHKVEPILD